MQAKRGRNTITMGIGSSFTRLVEHNQEYTKEILKKVGMETRQKVEEEIRLKEMQHKLEIQERELRIRELQAEVKSKQQVDATPPDILRPANLTKLVQHIQDYLEIENTHIWRKLGVRLEFLLKSLIKSIKN